MNSKTRSPSILSRALDRVWATLPRQSLDRLARRRGLSVVLLGLATFVGASGVGIIIIGEHRPVIHDEFSYLLQAETFAYGRLANPTPPEWEHFETFHVLMRPTYASKYPPAQGLFLTLGILVGHPIFAVWLSASLMVAAITWMLYGFVPPRWAFVGGVLSAIQWGIVGYWAQSFWGGAVAAIGGALVFGSVVRAFERLRIQNGILLGVGVAILASSRPYEGLLMCLVAGLALLSRIAVRKTKFIVRFLAPAVSIILVAAIGTAYYNDRVVNHPLRFPHQVYREQYALTPVFIWKDLNESIEYRHEVFESFWRSWSLSQYRKVTNPVGFLEEVLDKWAVSLLFFLGPGLILLMFLPRILRDFKVRLAAIGAAVVLVGSLLTLWSYPHYLAPAAGLFAVFLSGGLARLASHRGRFVMGNRWVVLILGAFFVSFLQRVVTAKPATIGDFPGDKTQIQRLLKKREGDHLVLVRYAPSHVSHAEWVYNSADLPSAAVIWAHDMGKEANRALMDAYPERKAWLVEVGNGEPSLAPLSKRAHYLP